MAFRLTSDPTQGRLYLLTATLFVSYLCVAISLPIVPIFVTGQLGFSNVWAGLGVGIAFAATILSRGYAGRLSDERGAKVATARGLIFYGAGATTSLIAGLLAQTPLAAVLVLFAGRLVRPPPRRSSRPTSLACCV